MRAKAGRVEIRPTNRVAHLRTGALACPDCGMPLATTVPLDWTEVIACGFCGEEAITREFVQREGWPPVDLIARL